MEHSLFNSIGKMKRFFAFLFFICTLFFLGSCSGGKGSSEGTSYAGTFTTTTGITFTLNEDSTTFIDFGDGINYEGRWELMNEDGKKFANIEFSGNKQYYYLYNGKLYHSRLEMNLDRFGVKVNYR